MNRIPYLCYCVVVASVLSGCATKNFYLNPALKTYSRAELESKDIKLPPNWNIDDFKKIALGVHITNDGKEIDRTLNTRLQTEIAKLKRFQVYSAHNVAGKMMFMDLMDVGEAELKTADNRPVLNYVLNARLSVKKNVREQGHRRYFNYSVTCDWSLEDLAKQEVAESGTAKGVTERMQILSYNSRRPIAGFLESQEEDAVFSATLKALLVVANKIGNKMPVGGRVKAVSRSGERMTLEKGFVDGIGKFHQVAVFARMGRTGRVAVPIALAEAMPGVTESNLHIYRWNDDNEDASALVAEFKTDPRGFAAKHRLYAVAYGMPIPPEWETDSIEADEKVLLEN